ncbi:MAG: diguanylate cyclase [Thermotogota bacterium]
MNYTVVKKLHENNNFTDFLILLEGNFYRLRRLSSIKFLDIDILSKYEKDFRMLNSSGIMFPEFIDLKKETPELYYPYFHEERIDIKDNTTVSLVSFMINLFDNFVHNINFVPNCIDLEDFLIDNKKNYYYIAPIFKDLTKDKIYKLKDINEENLIKVLQKIFEFLKFEENGNDKLVDFFRFIINEEIDCVSSLNKHFESFFDYENKINIRQPHYIGRSTLMEKVVNEIKEEKPSKMLIYGQQRVGKTSFIQNISNKLNTIMSFRIFNVRNLEQLNDNLSEYVDSSSQQKSIELNILEKIYFLQEKNSQKIVIIIDDYQEVEEEFSNFIDLLSQSNFTLNFNLIIITHDSTIQDQEKFNEFKKVEIAKFDFSEVEEMISSMMSRDFVQENQYFVENIYHHSAGLPGNIEEIMNELYSNKFIYFKNSEWHIDETNIKMKNFNDFVELKLKNIKRNIKKDIIDFSLLGNSFTSSEIKTLSELTQKEYDLDKVLATKVIQKENSYYRFFNMDYWEQFHNKINKQDLEKYHCKLYERSYNFQKKIWHLKQVNRDKQIIYDYIIRIKDAYENWSYIDIIQKSYQEIDNMNIKSDTILIYYIKYLIFSGNFAKAKKYLKYLNKKWMNIYKFRILAETEPVQTLEKVEESIDVVKNPYEKFYLKIIKGTILINSKFEDFESLKKLKNEIDELFEKNKDNKPFVDLYLSFVTDYGYYLQAVNKRESQIVNSNTLTIAKNYNMKKHILNISLLTAHDYLDNSYMYESLTEDAISLSKSSNDLSKLPEVYLNKAYMHLYKGNIDNFFFNINESIKYSNILNNKLIELRAYGFKAFYYFYVDDKENIHSQIKKIKNFMKLDYKRLKNRAKYYYYYLSSLYYLRDKNKEEIKKISKIIDESFPELNHINYLNKIFLSEDKETIVKNTEFLFKNDINLEEMMYLLNDKFLRTKELKELFIVKAADLIKILKENGYRLSLSILYEGISNFFALQEDYLRSFKYLRLAIINFRNLGLEEKVKKLEDYFYKMIKFSSSNSTSTDEKEKIKLNKHFYDDIINISTKIISLDNIQEILDKTLNFLKNKFPVNDVFLRVETDMFESQSSTSYDFLVPSEEVFSIEPLEVFYVSKYNDFNIKYYMKNKNLMINLNLFESIFDTIILLDEYLSATLNRLIHQQNSIKDYLTGAYSRRYLYLRLEEEYLKSLRENSIFTVAMFDLDDFKKVNDKHGHKEGDRVLKFFVDTINNNIRNLDILGRYGGEEFVLILPKINVEDTNLVLERIQERIKQNSKKIFGYEVSVSIGVCSSEKISDNNYKKLISMADEALYKSKNNGKDRITVFEE